VSAGKYFFHGRHLAHFMHGNIIKYCHRPFSSPEEMTEIIIRNINNLVQPNDTLWHLGDFSFKHHDIYRKQIKCQNVHLILGNHDKLSHSQLMDIFTSVKSLRRIKVNCRDAVLNIVLCHYAMRVWDLSHYNSFSFYGHSHYTLPDDPNIRSLDVGIDAVAGRATGITHKELEATNSWHLLKPENYRPMSISEINEILSKRGFSNTSKNTSDF
jgi:calcineurin-like phosphoesterase family protein